MVNQYLITLPVFPKGFHLITDHVIKVLPVLPEAGLLHVFIQHTSAALAINENADATVRHDMDKGFDQLAPENQPFYQHTVEGPDDMPAHLKAAMLGHAVSLPITQGELALGTWQGIYLGEHRNDGGRRWVVATLMGTE